MAPTLLATKLFIPPVRKNRVPRPRLTERLQAGLAGSLGAGPVLLRNAILCREAEKQTNV